MKRLFSIVALLMFTVAVTPIAEAKKFGGSKSFGKSYKTAPAPKFALAAPEANLAAVTEPSTKYVVPTLPAVAGMAFSTLDT